MSPKGKVRMIILVLRKLYKEEKGPKDKGYNEAINDCIDVIRHYFDDPALYKEE